ncbi:MAG: CopG family transcriptional regulator [Candidatus Methanomethylicia archaeon]
MSSVVSIKVRMDVKNKMLKYRDRVNWAEEIRRFIEERIRQIEAEDSFRRIFSELKNASWSVPRGFSKSTVREDRDSS